MISRVPLLSRLPPPTVVPVCSYNRVAKERTHVRTYTYVRPGSGSDVSIARYVSRRLPPPAISTGGH